MDASSSSSSLRPDDRRDRRRVGALLNQYYAIEGASRSEQQPEPAPAALACELDRQGFDARHYFDNMVALGQVSELVRRNTDLDTEVRDLDGTMQTLVYENYSKFIRATDVIRRMKCTLEGLSPDIKKLEGSMAKAMVLQDRTEEGVSERAGRLAGLLGQQRVCRKLKVLFGLPQTLEDCLKQGAHARAVAAYRCCHGILEQHREIPAFQSILDQAERCIGEVREALELRLKDPLLSVDESVGSAMTLVSLGEDQGRVARGYTAARAATLQQSCRECFAAPQNGRAPLPSSTEQEAPEHQAFRASCERAASVFVPRLCETVEGLRRLQDFCTASLSASDNAWEEKLVTDFVIKQVEELSKQTSRAVQQSQLPTKPFMACVELLKDSLESLSPLAPRLLPRLRTAFLSAAAGSAVDALFSHASAALVTNLGKLHGRCADLGSSESLDGVLEEIATTEQAIIMSCFSAMSNCQPLLGLLDSDWSSRQQLVQGIQAQLVTFFLAFAESCYLYIGGEGDEARGQDPSLPSLEGKNKSLASVALWPWDGLFGLALVRMGRHLEVKAIGKVSDVARDLFAGSGGAADFAPHPAVLRATRTAAQAVITHYVLLNGQRVAASFRALVTATKAASEHSAAVSLLLKEVFALDDRLAGILSDPRKPREASRQYRKLDRFRNSMELEMERLWAKKLQVYAPIPFNRNGATLGILRIGFKALFEHVREQTFTKACLQQVQVDCAVLQEAIRDLVAAEDAGVLESLLDEAIASASQRCPEPELLDASEVEELRGVRERAEAEGR